MIKAVVFDLDDTLYPEREYVLSGFRAVERHLGRAGAAERLTQLFCKSREGVFDRFAAEGGADARELHRVYINHFPDISLYADAAECLRKLKDRGLKLGLITDGRVVQQNNKIDALKIRAYFDAVILSDEFGAEFRKPHLKPFEAARDSLGVKYSEMLYAGDNPLKDFYVSALTDIKTVRIRRGGIYDECGYFKGVEPDFCVGSLAEIDEII